MSAWIHFVAAGRSWAIPASEIARVRPASDATPVPKAPFTPPSILGVIVDNDDARTVIDLGLLAGASPTEPSNRARLICLSGDGIRNLALLVERILETSGDEDMTESAEHGRSMKGARSALRRLDPEGRPVLLANTASIRGALEASRTERMAAS